MVLLSEYSDQSQCINTTNARNPYTANATVNYVIIAALLVKETQQVGI